jgi:hypothetical protein
MNGVNEGSLSFLALLYHFCLALIGTADPIDGWID